MSKKRFHKLFRAWLVRAGARKGADKGAWKIVMRHLNDFKCVTKSGAKPYAEIWEVITSNGALDVGVGRT